MAAQQIRKNCILTGDTGWISIHIDATQIAGGIPRLPATVLPQATSLAPEACGPFQLAQQSRVPLPERFPRLTLFAIALTLLASTLTAEFDYLRSAGYYWP